MPARPSLLIAGAGRTGAQLAKRMCVDWDVRIVDPSEEALADESLAVCVAKATGDATSALVLRQAGIETASAVVACTNDDEKNLEVLRVAREQFGVEKVYGVLRMDANEQRYREQGVELVDRFQAIAAMLASRISGGQKVATNIGLGIGEIVEVEVLEHSSVVGRRLMDLRPRRWLIGAIYRGEQLVVPHGDTRIQAKDRVLVIGDTDILPSVITLIGSGHSEFPLHFGSRIALLGGRHDKEVVGEVRYIAERGAAKEVAVLLTADEPKGLIAQSVEKQGLEASVEVLPRASSRLDLAVATREKDVGLIVMEATPLPWLSRVGLKRSYTVSLVDRARAPVLVARGTHPYGSVLLALAELPFSMDAAQLAIDVARRFDAELHLAVVHHAPLVVGEEMRERLEERKQQIVTLAKLYNLKTKLVTLEGNPIEQLVEASAEHQLLVLPYPRYRRSSLTRPDVAQNVIHRAHCSVMIMPVDG